MSCELGEDPNALTCERDEHECVTEGQPLHWPSACLDYAVQVDGSPKAGLDGDEFAKLVEQAFLVWQTAECPGGGNPRFEPRFQGFVACQHRESLCGGASANVNVVLFGDSEWPSASNEMGLTTPAGGSESGRLVDADLEFNAEDFGLDESSIRPGAALLPDCPRNRALPRPRPQRRLRRADGGELQQREFQRPHAERGRRRGSV